MVVVQYLRVFCTKRSAIVVLVGVQFQNECGYKNVRATTFFLTIGVYTVPSQKSQ
jgi:hypothetical protein